MKNFYLLFLLIFIPCSAFANDSKMMEYKNGPAVTLYSGGSFAVSYYFGNNNAFSADFWVQPYQATQVFRSESNYTTNETSIGANFYYHMPIKKDLLNNQVFFLWGAGWGQFFGTSVNKPIDYCWGAWGDVGFEYRFNPHLRTQELAFCGKLRRRPSCSSPLNLWSRAVDQLE